MLKSKIVGAVVLAAVAVSPAAMADDRGTNTALGAVVGAAIGASAGGSGGALVGGVLGAAVGNSISTRDDRRYYDNRNYAIYRDHQVERAAEEGTPTTAQVERMEPGSCLFGTRSERCL